MPGVGADWDSRHIPLAVEVCECVSVCWYRPSVIIYWDSSCFLAFLLSVAALARFRPGLSRPSTDGAGVARPPFSFSFLSAAGFFFPKSNPRDAIFSDAVNSNGGRNFWLHRPGGWKADGRRMGGGWEADGRRMGGG